MGKIPSKRGPWADRIKKINHDAKNKEIYPRILIELPKDGGIPREKQDIVKNAMDCLDNGNVPKNLKVVLNAVVRSGGEIPPGALLMTVGTLPLPNDRVVDFVNGLFDQVTRKKP